MLATLAPIEREVAARDRQFVLRLVPYRASDNSVKGVADAGRCGRPRRLSGELRATKEEVSADLRRMSRLHNVSTRLAGTEDRRRSWKKLRLPSPTLPELTREPSNIW